MSEGKGWDALKAKTPDASVQSNATDGPWPQVQYWGVNRARFGVASASPGWDQTVFTFERQGLSSRWRLRCRSRHAVAPGRCGRKRRRPPPAHLSTADDIRGCRPGLETMTMKTAAFLALGALLLSACDGVIPRRKTSATALDQMGGAAGRRRRGHGRVQEGLPQPTGPSMRNRPRGHLCANSGNIKTRAQADATRQIRTFMKGHFANMARASDASLAAMFW